MLQQETRQGQTIVRFHDDACDSQPSRLLREAEAIVAQARKRKGEARLEKQ